MATLVTEICNMSLSRLGAKRLAYTGTTETDLDANTTLVAVLCNLNYEQTKDALLESFLWPFASARKTLPIDTETPDFEWDYQYKLPADYWRKVSIYENNGFEYPKSRYAFEGDFILTNYDTLNLRYIKNVTDPVDFPPFFIEVLVLRLAKKLIPALAGTKSSALVDDIKKDSKEIELKAAALYSHVKGTGGYSGWNLARHGGLGINSQVERLL